MGVNLSDHADDYTAFATGQSVGYGGKQWILARLKAIQCRARQLQSLARRGDTDVTANPSESFNTSQFAAVVAVREIGRRNGNYRSESFNADHFGTVMAERERRRLKGDE